MEILMLYRYHRDKGGLTESPVKPVGVDYTTRYRLVAGDSKLLTNGTIETCCVDVDNPDGWWEIDAPVEDPFVEYEDSVV